MNVCEIFRSIQGESTLQGNPTVFVRLAGCNLDCAYCDTKYARVDSVIMSIENIILNVRQYTVNFVCITGGEPLIQKETPLLAVSLCNLGYSVSIETNGSIDASVVPEPVIRIIDIKTPGSGESGTTDEHNVIDIRQSDEFKFVITNRNDFDYSVDFAQTHLIDKSPNILFSPAYKTLNPSILSEWILSDFPFARLNLQLHKYIWPNDAESRTPR